MVFFHVCVCCAHFNNILIWIKEAIISIFHTRKMCFSVIFVFFCLFVAFSSSTGAHETRSFYDRHAYLSQWSLCILLLLFGGVILLCVWIPISISNDNRLSDQTVHTHTHEKKNAVLLQYIYMYFTLKSVYNLKTDIFSFE